MLLKNGTEIEVVNLGTDRECWNLSEYSYLYNGEEIFYAWRDSEENNDWIDEAVERAFFVKDKYRISSMATHSYVSKTKIKAKDFLHWLYTLSESDFYQNIIESITVVGGKVKDGKNVYAYKSKTLLRGKYSSVLNADDKVVRDIIINAWNNGWKFIILLENGGTITVQNDFDTYFVCKNYDIYKYYLPCILPEKHLDILRKKKYMQGLNEQDKL